MGKRDGFYLYFDWEQPFDRLTDDELGKIVRAMMKYVKHGEQPPTNFEGGAAFVADFVFPQIARSIQYAENGAKGGKKTQSKPTVEPMVEPMVEPLNININNKHKRKRTLNIVHHDEQETAQTNSFESFWKVYPKKQSKPTAQKAWDKLNPDAELTEAIINAVERAKMSRQWKERDGQYIPLPASYLNQRRWEDDLSGEIAPWSQPCPDFLADL